MKEQGPNKVGPFPKSMVTVGDHSWTLMGIYLQQTLKQRKYFLPRDNLAISSPKKDSLRFLMT